MPCSLTSAYIANLTPHSFLLLVWLIKAQNANAVVCAREMAAPCTLHCVPVNHAHLPPPDPRFTRSPESYYTHLSTPDLLNPQLDRGYVHIQHTPCESYTRVHKPTATHATTGSLLALTPRRLSRDLLLILADKPTGVQASRLLPNIDD